MSALHGSHSAAIDVARAMALPKVRPVHGSIAQMAGDQFVYCGRCQRWHEVMVSATLALAVHELIDHHAD